MSRVFPSYYYSLAGRRRWLGRSSSNARAQRQSPVPLKSDTPGGRLFAPLDCVSSKTLGSNFRILSTARLLNCSNNEFSCFIAREIGYRQVRDRLPPADLLFCIHRNLGDLYCYPRGLSINDFNVSFLLLGHDITSKEDAIFMSLI